MNITFGVGLVDGSGCANNNSVSSATACAHINAMAQLTLVLVIFLA
jgi:hypothetical protein